MAKLVWDAQGEHFFETGVDHGVLFLMKADGTYDNGVVWNGLTNVAENPDGAEETEIYADNVKYLGIRAAENFGFTINCYSHPRAFYKCDGGAEPVEGVVLTQQNRNAFGFSYRTLIGNDTQGQNYGYKIHLVYNATTSPSSKDNNTVNDTPEADEMSYECSTTPVAVGRIDGVDYKNTAHIIIDSTTVDATKLASFEEILYGGDNASSTLPTPAEVINHFKAA